MIYSRLLLMVLFFVAQQATAMEINAQESDDSELDRQLYRKLILALNSLDVGRLKNTLKDPRFKSRDIINKKGNIGRPLDLALNTESRQSNTRTELLLMEGANVNMQDENGNTILIREMQKHLISGDGLDRIRLLLAYDADPTIANNERQTVFSLVEKAHAFFIRESRRQEILAMLKNYATGRLKNKQLYDATFALAYRKQIAGFAGLMLPRDMVAIEIKQWMDLPPFGKMETPGVLPQQK